MHAHFCTALNGGPVTVGNGSMTYAIDGVDAATTMRAVIISDSIYSLPSMAVPKVRLPGWPHKLDIGFAGPQNGQIGVDADAYDFVIDCMSATDCAFSLTWSAIY